MNMKKIDRAYKILLENGPMTVEDLKRKFPLKQAPTTFSLATKMMRDNRFEVVGREPKRNRHNRIAKVTIWGIKDDG